MGGGKLGGLGGRVILEALGTFFSDVLRALERMIISIPTMSQMK